MARLMLNVNFTEEITEEMVRGACLVGVDLTLPLESFCDAAERLRRAKMAARDKAVEPTQ
ncbi:MAG TPA: hypothetical protein VFO62_10060 [Candidatus Binatia bacterium]|nr:hypothetical protein [Candidatus Binatia bacterium]